MSPTNRKRKRTRRSAVSRSNIMILKLLLLVVVVLVIFEGRIIHTMYLQHAGSTTASPVMAETAESNETVQPQVPATVTDPFDFSENLAATADTASVTDTSSLTSDVGLAGLSAISTDNTQDVQTTSQEDENKISEVIDSPAVVPLQSEKTDDAYFKDAVFIGDSRMEGFRNTSGITQGQFLTSVGMSLAAISTAKVKSPDGEITVYQGLSGRQYGKIYLMLGANDLGYYPWDEFKGHVEEVMGQMHKLQPDAIIYICGVIYVEGYKISTDYVNNDNVRKVNGYLLEVCEDLGYCHYLNLNEVFTNGYGSLIDGATSDGVHLEPKYTALMLDYLKSHYYPVQAKENTTEAETDKA